VRDAAELWKTMQAQAHLAEETEKKLTRVIATMRAMRKSLDTDLENIFDWIVGNFGFPPQDTGNQAADPQPKPGPGREDVAAWVCYDIDDRIKDAKLAEAIEADIEARVAVGLERYGTRLQTFNGRDFLVDAYQEAIDLTMYARGAILEQDSPGPDGAESQDELWDLYALAWDAMVCARKLIRNSAAQGSDHVPVG